MSTVVLSGAADPLGQRVTAALGSATRRSTRIVVVGDDELHSPDLKARIEGATAVVHLDGGVDETRARARRRGRGRRPARRAPVERDGLRRLAQQPSAAHRGRPVAAEPGSRLRRAGGRARASRRPSGSTTTPARRSTVLRPAVPVAEEASGWLARGLREASAIRAAGPDDPPCQYVHLDDLASAVCARARTSASTARSTSRPTVGSPATGCARSRAGRGCACPNRARRFAWLRWRLNPSSAPPGLLPYTLHPWVVANDRIKAAGWAPAFSNEEAYVAGHKAAPWATVSPQRRQEIALAGAGAGVIAVVLAIVLLIRRRSGRRASRTE